MTWTLKAGSIEQGAVEYESDRWVCGDGDFASVEIYRLKLDPRMDVMCFSGAMSSYVIIDLTDTPRSGKVKLTPEDWPEKFNPDDPQNVINYFLWVADALCKVFCDEA